MSTDGPAPRPQQSYVERSEDVAAARKHAILRRRFAYSDSRRGERMAPAGADIDPLDFRYALGWVTLVDVEGSGSGFRPAWSAARWRS